MRAWRLHDTGGPSSYRLDQVAAPEPEPGEVRVLPRIVGLNHLDLWLSLGLPAPRRLPHVAGADAAGVVDAVGAGVAGLEPGDEVVIDPSISCRNCPECLRGDVVYCPDFGVLGEHHPGTLAEAVVVPARNVVPRPRGLDWATAGTFGLVTGTAYRMLRRARLSAGETVLVVGVGGGVSSAATVLAVAMGAEVYVTSRSAAKVAWAVAQGARAGFSSESEFSEEARQIGAGVDVVIENVGAATWDQSLRSLRRGGRMVVCGATAGTKVGLSVPVLFYRQLEIIGSTMFTQGEFADVLGLVGSGRVRPPVDRILPFEQLPEALEILAAGSQLGKVGLSLEHPVGNLSLDI